MKLARESGLALFLLLVMLSGRTWGFKDMHSMNALRRRTAKLFQKLRKVEDIKHDIDNGLLKENRMERGRDKRKMRGHMHGSSFIGYHNV